MPDTPELVWWMLAGIFAAGFGLNSFLLTYWFKKLNSSLTAIWQEIKESRGVESDLRNQITRIQARCDERHK